jgi:hypothetical protein
MKAITRNCLAVACLVVLSWMFAVSCDGNINGERFVAFKLVVDESPAGIHVGSFTSTGGANPVASDVVGIISEDLDIQIMVGGSSPIHYAGEVFADGTALKGSLTVYRGGWGRFFGVDGVAAMSLVGSVAERNGMSGEYAGAGDQGRFALQYQSEYESGSGLDQISGVWFFDLASSGGGIYSVSLDIDPNGAIFGVNTAGCVFSGQMSTIDVRYNTYRPNIMISECGAFNGDYSGLAFISDLGTGQSKLLNLSVSNDVFAFATVFHKN